MATNAIELTTIPAAARNGSCTGGTPYTGAATASSTTPATAMEISPSHDSACRNDQRENPAAVKRRNTPRSR